MRVLLLGEGVEFAVVAHVGAKAAQVGCHVFLLELAHVARQLEQLQRIFQRDALNELALAQVGVGGLGFALSVAQRHIGAVFTQAGRDALTRFGVYAQLAGAAHRATVDVLPGLDGRVELAVEAGQHLRPVLVAVGNLVKLVLYLGRELIVHNHREVSHQKVVHHHGRIGREQLGFFRAVVLGLHFGVHRVAVQRQHVELALLALTRVFFYVAALLHGTNGRRISRRPANAHLLQLLHQ